MGRHQLTWLEVSLYQRAVLARGLDHWHWHQIPDRRMEQLMGYSAAVGTLVMDELASTCERAEVRFTGVCTDLGIVENDTAIVQDRVRVLGDWMDGTDVELHQMRANRVAIQDEVDRLRVTIHEMRRDMGVLVHVNQVMHTSLVDLQLSIRHGGNNPIVIDDEVGSVMEAGLVPESKGVWEITREEFEQGVDTWASSREL